jgi:hypothetical protein
MILLCQKILMRYVNAPGENSEALRSHRFSKSWDGRGSAISRRTTFEWSAGRISPGGGE